MAWLLAAALGVNPPQQLLAARRVQGG